MSIRIVEPGAEEPDEEYGPLPDEDDLAGVLEDEPRGRDDDWWDEEKYGPR